MARDAEPLERLAEQAQVIADESTDAECRRALECLAIGYERLAEHARTCRSHEGGEPVLNSRREQRGQ